MKFKTITTDDRKLKHSVLEKIDIYLSKWKPGTPVDVSITRKQAKISDPMRKYYFAEVLPKFSRVLGYEKDEDIFFHQQCKIRYFEKDPKYFDENNKTTIKPDKLGIWRNVPSVFGNDSDLDISAKKRFVDWVVRKASKYVYIEDPK